MLSTLVASTVQYVLMLGVAVGCVCLGAAVKKSKTKQ